MPINYNSTHSYRRHIALQRLADYFNNGLQIHLSDSLILINGGFSFVSLPVAGQRLANSSVIWNLWNKMGLKKGPCREVRSVAALGLIAVLTRAESEAAGQKFSLVPPRLERFHDPIPLAAAVTGSCFKCYWTCVNTSGHKALS